MMASSVVAAAAMLPTPISAQNTFSGGFRVSSLNALLDDLGQSFLPALFKNAGTDLLAEPLVDETFNIFGIEDLFGLTVLVENLMVDPFTNDQLTLETEYSDTSAGVFRLRATPAKVKLMASATAGLLGDCPIPAIGCNCAVSLNPTISLEEVSIEFKLQRDNATAAKLECSDIEFSKLTLDFEPEIEGFCDFIGEFLALAATRGPLETFLFRAFKGGFEDYLEKSMDGITIPFDMLSTVTIGGATITPSMNITTLQTSYDDISATLSTTFTANLDLPNFRTGYSYATPMLASESVQSADVRGLASAHMSFPGINALIQSVWYTQWATFATNEAAMSSSLCNTELSQANFNAGFDPCPFPPYMQTSARGDSDFWFMRLLYTFSFHTGYTYSIVIPPPTLDFVDNLLQGTVDATLLVQGTTRRGEVLEDLFSMTGTVDVKSPLPTYNTDTAKIIGLQIADLNLRDTSVNWIEKSTFGWLFDPTSWINSRVIEALLPSLTKQANIEIATILDANALEIPPIPGVPMREKAIQISLVNPTVTAVASSSAGVGFLDLDSSVSVTVIDNPDPFVLPVVLQTKNVTEVDRTMLSRIQEKANTERNPNARYTYQFNDPVSGSRATRLLTWSPQADQFLVEVTNYAFPLN